MKPIRWTRHALDALGDRAIDRAEAELALRSPDAIGQAARGRLVYMRRFVDPVLGDRMLLRVIVEDDDDAEEQVVVTIYKTSRFYKYLGGNGHEGDLRPGNGRSGH